MVTTEKMTNDESQSPKDHFSVISLVTLILFGAFGLMRWMDRAILIERSGFMERRFEINEPFAPTNACSYPIPIPPVAPKFYHYYESGDNGEGIHTRKSASDIETKTTTIQSEYCVFVGACCWSCNGMVFGRAR